MFFVVIFARRSTVTQKRRKNVWSLNIMRHYRAAFTPPLGCSAALIVVQIFNHIFCESHFSAKSTFIYEKNENGDGKFQIRLASEQDWTRNNVAITEKSNFRLDRNKWMNQEKHVKDVRIEETSVESASAQRVWAKSAIHVWSKLNKRPIRRGCGNTINLMNEKMRNF